MSFIKYQHNKLLIKKYYKKTGWDIYNDYNFIKVDCEGCEFELFKYIDLDRLQNKKLAIAIHENSYYDQNIAQRIISICPHQIFKIGFETIYTNSLRGID